MFASSGLVPSASRSCDDVGLMRRLKLSAHKCQLAVENQSEYQGRR